MAKVSRTTFYSFKICDKLKTTQTSKKYSFPSYFGCIQTNTISRVHSCIAQNYSYASHAFVFSIIFLLKKLPIVVVRDVCMSVRPSVRVCQCLFVIT